MRIPTVHSEGRFGCRTGSPVPSSLHPVRDQTSFASTHVSLTVPIPVSPATPLTDFGELHSCVRTKGHGTQDYGDWKVRIGPCDGKVVDEMLDHFV